MDKVTHQIRLEQWTRLIEECSNSSLTKIEWCQQNNVSIKSYYYWQRKIRKYLAETGSLPVATSSAFVELKNPAFLNCEHQKPHPDSCASIIPAAVLQKNDITVILSNSAERSFISALLGALKND